MTGDFWHIPVMLDECMHYLNLGKGDIFCDATLGGAGHSASALEYLQAPGMLIGIDQDDYALKCAKQRLEELTESRSASNAPEVLTLKGNFGSLDSLLLQAEVPYVNAFLFDLGVSSVQIDMRERGFSFKEDAPLDMRMNPSGQSLCAADIVNTYSAQDLARIMREYADEKWASRIAQFIVQAREKQRIERSGELVDIIKAAIPSSARRAGGHPAKRCFQALRIEVNSELEALKSGLRQAIAWLAPQGRIAVISYHSLEDRIVKEVFKEGLDTCICPPDLPVCSCGRKPYLKLVTRKALLPSKLEIERNPRSRSAKLRVAYKL